ncbi:MAG: UDP-N-acetylmuramate dehydrogenase [Lachnospiraceae bacterium]|nr:UDP-N-acetylmuramate dehydrogenase [Lachnospiraceae bacterium]
MNSNLLEEIKGIVESERVLVNEPMSKHTTFRVGGPCDVYVSIKNEKEAESIIRLLSAYNEPFFVIGNGSNLLVKDEGYRGVIIEIGKNYSDINIQGDIVEAKAGALLVKVANECLKASLTGFEFASGIPGTIGGGVFMNAGAYGGELKDVIEKVKVLNYKTGEILEKSCDEMMFSYRHSIAKEEPFIILSAVLKLSHGNIDDIKSRMDELKEQRTSKQPLEYPSAGSTFKRPEGYFAGKLIQDAGLKGYTVGGAQVSEKHSGFVINIGDATAADILTLIDDVRDKVKDQFDVELEPEVCILQ